MTDDELDPIDCAFAEGTPIDRALAKAVQEALKRHKQAGNPIVEWRDGQLHWIAPEDIPLVDEG